MSAEEDWIHFRRVLERARHAHLLEIENEHLRLARETLRAEVERLQERVDAYGERVRRALDA